MKCNRCGVEVSLLQRGPNYSDGVCLSCLSKSGDVIIKRGDMDIVRMRVELNFDELKLLRSCLLYVLNSILLNRNKSREYLMLIEDIKKLLEKLKE